jgi:gliding motility-associated lipoprotein GldH
MKPPDRPFLIDAKARQTGWQAFIPFPLLVFVLVSCSTKTIYDKSLPVPGDSWDMNERVSFEVPVTDTAVSYRFFLNLRHTTDYRYSNIYFFIRTRFPDGRTGRDTVECILSDREGKWLGKGVSNIRDNQVLLRRGLRFPQRGNYIFEIEQAMRDEELEGVRDVGIRLEKEFRAIN